MHGRQVYANLLSVAHKDRYHLRRGFHWHASHNASLLRSDWFAMGWVSLGPFQEARNEMQIWITSVTVWVIATWLDSYARDGSYQDDLVITVLLFTWWFDYVVCIDEDYNWIEYHYWYDIMKEHWNVSLVFAALGVTQVSLKIFVGNNDNLRTHVLHFSLIH